MSDKNKIIGDGNLFVGRDFNVTVEDLRASDKKLSKIIESKLKGTDEYVNKSIPAGILNQKTISINLSKVKQS